MLEQADDMAIDIPFIWLYLAELLSPLLREGGIAMRDLFRSEFLCSCKHSDRNGISRVCLLFLSFGIKVHSTPKIQLQSE